MQQRDAKTVARQFGDQAGHRTIDDVLASEIGREKADFQTFSLRFVRRIFPGNVGR